MKPFSAKHPARGGAGGKTPEPPLVADRTPPVKEAPPYPATSADGGADGLGGSPRGFQALRARQPWLSSLPRGALVACYLTLFFVVSESLLGPLKQLPFISDDWAVINFVRENSNPPCQLLFKGLFAQADTGGGNYRQLHIYAVAKLFNRYGLDAVPYHKFYVGLHQLNCLLLCVFGALLTHSLLLGMAVSFLFLFHPAPVEAIAWICTGSNILIGFFGMIMLICVTQALRPRRAGIVAIVVASLAYLGACLSQENGAALPLAVGAVFLTLKPRDRFWWRRGLLSAGCFVGVLAAFMVFLLLIRVTYFQRVAGETTTGLNFVTMTIWTFLPFLVPKIMPLQEAALLFCAAVALVLLRKNFAGLLLAAVILLLIAPVAHVYVTVRSLYFNCMLACVIWGMMLSGWPEESRPKPASLLAMGVLGLVFLYQHASLQTEWIKGGYTTRQAINLLTKYHSFTPANTIYLTGTNSFSTWYSDFDFADFVRAVSGGRSYPRSIYDEHGRDYRFFCSLPEEVRKNRRNCFLCVEDGFVHDVTDKVRAERNLYFFSPYIKGGSQNVRGELMMYGLPPAYVTFPAGVLPGAKKVWIVLNMRGGMGPGEYSKAQVLLDDTVIGECEVPGQGVFSTNPATERRDYVFPAVLANVDPHRVEIRLLNDFADLESRTSIDLFIRSVAVLLEEPQQRDAGERTP